MNKPSKNAVIVSRTGKGSDDKRGERLSKIMAERGICSRREADAYISRGLVYVNGERITTLGTRISAGAKISLADSAQKRQAEQRTVLLHKPIGYVSGQPEPGYIPAVTLVNRDNYFANKHSKIDIGQLDKMIQEVHRKLAPAGRLDLDSSGLLVFTQDGRIARQLIGDNTEVDKEYLVRVDMLPDEQTIKKLRHGLELDGKRLRPAKIDIINDGQLQFTLREGRKRQIRRMCEFVGLRAVGLKRVRIGNVRLQNLPLGKWRFLGQGEGF